MSSAKVVERMKKMKVSERMKERKLTQMNGGAGAQGSRVQTQVRASDGLRQRLEPP